MSAPLLAGTTPPTAMHTLRSLLKTPWLSAVIIASLAIGIGCNTVIFSWLRGAIFQPLPTVTDEVWSLETKDDTGLYVTTSWLEYRDLREMTPSLAGITAQRPKAFYLGDTERESRVFGQLVSENFFDVLGVKPAQGRFFRPDEATQPGSAPVVVISHDFWQGYFKGAPDILGRSLKLNGHTFTVIGVTAERFRGGMNSLGFELWAPITMAAELQASTSELSHRATRPYLMLARLRPGASRAEAQGELDRAARHLIATYPDTNRGLGYQLIPLWKVPRGGDVAVYTLATLQTFSTLILIVVCANTANLLLARASVRQREIGVRLALGASPGRIIAMLLAESVALAVVAAGIGMVLAHWGVSALKQIPLPGTLPIKASPYLDQDSLVFAISLGALCGTAFGLVPAWQLARGDVLQALRGGRGSIGGRSRLRDALVGLQVAVAVVMLVLTGLYLKSFHNSLQAHPGFDVGRVMLAQVDLGGRGYTKERGAVFLDQVLQSLTASPGVEAAAAAALVPLDLRGIPTGVISVEGKPFDAERKILYYGATPGYLATMGITVIEGRDLSPLARTDLPLDAVINEEMARRYWPEGSPVGRHFELSGITYEVAGVARNAKYLTLNENPRPLAWPTLRAGFISTPTLHVRPKAGDPRALISPMRAAVNGLDRELALLDPRSLAQHVENNLFLQKVPAQLLTVVGPLALALPAIGLYAVLAYSLAQRTQEIGVRLTLGSTPGGVVRLMIWQHMRVVLVSTAVGWVAALGFGWFLRDHFVGVTIGDPIIYGGVPLLLLVVATLACWLPARKAAEIDPMVALRSE